MNPKITVSASIGAILLIAGCNQSTDLAARNVPGFGDSVHTNMAVQIINPSPDYTGLGPPSMSGVRAAGALKRYQEGEVIKPKAVPTSGKGQ